MSFKVNSSQQISFNDSVFSLTAREKKALDNSWAKIFADEIFPNIDEERFSVLFFYWMRCSELSADRAAVLCDGGADKMSEVCMRLAGYDKDIGAYASKEEFMVQAQEYREMVKNSKWDRTLEFLALSTLSHPLMTVRALECEEWSKSEQFQRILDGTYAPEIQGDTVDKKADISIEGDEETQHEKKGKPKFEFPKFKKKEEEPLEERAELKLSTPDEIRKLEMSRNVQSGNTQNLKSMVIQRSFPKWSVAERRKTAAASDQAAVCACAHSRYFTGGSPSGLRV